MSNTGINGVTAPSFWPVAAISGALVSVSQEGLPRKDYFVMFKSASISLILLGVLAIVAGIVVLLQAVRAFGSAS